MNEISAKKKIAGVAFGTAALVLAGGAAFGYWSVTGSGSGTADTGDVMSITVNQVTPPFGLGPGVPPQLLSGNFDNPNGPVYVTSVTAVVSGTNQPGCDETDFIIAGAAPVGAQIAGPGSATGSWSGLTIQFNNKATNQDACKNAIVNISYTAN